MLGKIEYTIDEIRKNGRNKQWWRARTNARLNSLFQQNIWPGRSGIDVPSADWDNLIILDGCRRDLFKEVADVDRFDEYRSVTSRGSATFEWCDVNWDGDHGDVSYVTGNPVPSRSIPGSLFELREVWRDSFDRDIGTVPPEKVTASAMAAYKEHPDKRLVIHYLQPHYPFIGFPDLQFTSFDQTPEMQIKERRDLPTDVWEALGKGIVDEEDVWNGYRKNLELVMEEVWTLAEELDGKTVITSDHGNGIGERSYPIPVGTYGHPPYLRLPPLVDVPWAVIKGDRRDVTAGRASETSNEETTEKVEKQLEALGYA